MIDRHWDDELRQVRDQPTTDISDNSKSIDSRA